jgi:hypothetical protein
MRWTLKQRRPGLPPDFRSLREAARATLYDRRKQAAGRHPDDPRDRRYRDPPGISVHDHIIVGKNGHASLKGMRLI